jgi:hypothetical protein
MLTVHIDSLPQATDDDAEADGPVQPPTYGSITFVDLAGSERPKATGSSGTGESEVSAAAATTVAAVTTVAAATTSAPGGLPYQ